MRFGVLETFVNSESSSAKDHFNLGKCYLNLRKFKSAQEAFEKGCELFDSNRALKLGLGLAMAHRGKVKEAQEHFEKMVEEKDDEGPAGQAVVHMVEGCLFGNQGPVR